jgi:hypothetical protein
LLCAAQISGIVHDPSGAPVVQASVILEPPNGTPLTANTDPQGRFHFDYRLPGAYHLTVSHEDFEAFTQELTLAAKPVELSIALKLSAVKTSITVSSTSRSQLSGASQRPITTGMARE